MTQSIKALCPLQGIAAAPQDKLQTHQVEYYRWELGDLVAQTTKIHQTQESRSKGVFFGASIPLLPSPRLPGTKSNIHACTCPIRTSLWLLYIASYSGCRLHLGFVLLAVPRQSLV
jgi:hypothetical protein